MDLLKEASLYLTKEKSWKRIIVKIKERYIKLGKLGGTIELTNLSQEEKSLLSSIDYKYYKAQDAKISVNKIVEHFKSGKFAKIDFEELLKYHFGEDKLITNKEANKKYYASKEKFFNKLLKEYPESKGNDWINEVYYNKSYGYNTIISLYNSSEKNNVIHNKKDNRIVLYKTVVNVIKGINRLSFSSTDIERLPIFSSKITKDPHYFDENNIAGKLLIQAIAYLNGVVLPSNAEEKSKLMYESGIVKDDISSFTISYGLEGYDENEKSLNWSVFTNNEEPLLLATTNLIKVKKIVPSREEFVLNSKIPCMNDKGDSRLRKVFIFENPAVFREIMEKSKHLKPTLICTSGQLKLASYILINKLIDNVDEIFYAGDLDPEGVLIAKKLKESYGNKIKLWRFTKEDYLKSVSNIPFTQSRENKLKNIQTADLVELIDCMKKNKNCAYQELLIDDYLEDVIRNLR